MNLNILIECGKKLKGEIIVNTRKSQMLTPRRLRELIAAFIHPYGAPLIAGVHYPSQRHRHKGESGAASTRRPPLTTSLMAKIGKGLSSVVQSTEWSAGDARYAVRSEARVCPGPGLCYTILRRMTKTQIQ